MDNTDVANRKGRTFTKNAELPAAPAANRKGRSGKQQLDAKTTLPRAATLAANVRRERGPFWFDCFVLRMIAISSASSRLQHVANIRCVGRISKNCVPEGRCCYVGSHRQCEHIYQLVGFRSEEMSAQ